MNRGMKQVGREWLKMVRGEGDAATKRAYLLEKGLVDEEVDELIKEDEAEAASK